MITYNIEGLYPKHGTKKGREWKTWLRDLTEQQARDGIASAHKRKKEWLSDCYTDLRLIRVTTEVVE